MLCARFSTHKNVDHSRNKIPQTQPQIPIGNTIRIINTILLAYTIYWSAGEMFLFESTSTTTRISFVCVCVSCSWNLRAFRQNVNSSIDHLSFRLVFSSSFFSDRELKRWHCFQYSAFLIQYMLLERLKLAICSFFLVHDKNNKKHKRKLIPKMRLHGYDIPWVMVFWAWVCAVHLNCMQFLSQIFSLCPYNNIMESIMFYGLYCSVSISVTTKKKKK